MAQLPAYPGLATVKRLTNKEKIEGDYKSGQGKNNFIAWSDKNVPGGVSKAWRAAPGFDIAIDYRQINKTEKEALETFYHTNVLLPVTTRALVDGREYCGYFVGEPIVTKHNAIRFDVRLSLRAWMGPEPGAIAHYRETGIVDSSGNITDWTNENTDNSDYDLVPVGSSGNVKTATVNGLTVAHFGDSGAIKGLETTTPGDVDDDVTVFLAFIFDEDAPGADQTLFDAQSDAAKTHKMWTDTSASDGVILTSDVSLVTGRDYPGSARVQTAELIFRASGSHSISLSHTESATSIFHTYLTWDFMRLGLDRSGANPLKGKICEMIVYDSDMSTVLGAGGRFRNDNILFYLRQKWRGI